MTLGKIMKGVTLLSEFFYLDVQSPIIPRFPETSATLSQGPISGPFLTPWSPSLHCASGHKRRLNHLILY